MSRLELRGWARPEELRQVAADYRAAIAYIDTHGWCRVVSERPDGSVCAARALGIVCGVDGWDSFAGRASLALSTCYRVTGMLLVQVNDKADNWADVRSIMVGIAEDCEKVGGSDA